MSGRVIQFPGAQKGLPIAEHPAAEAPGVGLKLQLSPHHLRVGITGRTRMPDGSVWWEFGGPDAGLGARSIPCNCGARLEHHRSIRFHPGGAEVCSYPIGWEGEMEGIFIAGFLIALGAL